MTGSDGYFMVSSFVGLVRDGDKNLQDGHKATIDCKRFIEVYIVEDVIGEFCAKGTGKTLYENCSQCKTNSSNHNGFFQDLFKVNF